jgi:hypothetical protein
MAALATSGPCPRPRKTAIMGVEKGPKIYLRDAVRPLLSASQKSEVQFSSIYYPGTVNVCVGSVVQILAPEEVPNWYLYVTSVQADVDAEVSGYFLFTDMDVRKSSGSLGFKYEELFLTHQTFTAPLSSVLSVVQVLPAFMRSEAEDSQTMYYSMFWDPEFQELRDIDFQLHAPGNLIEFLAHSSVLGSGGGARNLSLMKKSFRKAMLDFCEKWRLRATNPKRGVKVEMDLDLQHLMCLPFSILENSHFDRRKDELIIPVLEEFVGILGEGWEVVQLKARRVQEGEVLEFKFFLPADIHFDWERQETVVKFEGVSMTNGAGVVQWSTRLELQLSEG